MSFAFHCPHCGQKIEAEEEWIGREAECPGCKNTLTIPQLETMKNQNASTPIASATQPGFQQPFPTQPNFQQQPFPSQSGFVQPFYTNTPKNPVPSSSFAYQKVDNKFYFIGDYSTIFSLINEFCTRAGFNAIKTDINLGYLSLKYNSRLTLFVIFYQEFDKMVIETATNAYYRISDKPFKPLQKLNDAIETSFYQYKIGYLPTNCYEAVIPQAYQKAEIDYTSQAKAMVWEWLLTVILLGLLGIIISFIYSIILLVKIYSTEKKKGQEYIYLSIFSVIVGVFINMMIIQVIQELFSYLQSL